MTFGQELSRLLHAHHLSYRDLSRRTGLAPTTIGHYVTGRRPPPSDHVLELLASGLDEPPEVFFEWRCRRVGQAIGGRPAIVDELYRRLCA